MAVQTYEKLRIATDIDIGRIIEYEQIQVENNHIRVDFSAEIDERGITSLSRPKEGRTIKVSNAGKTLFEGIVQKAWTTDENGFTVVHMSALSGSILLDQTKKSRSFQDITMTYEALVNSVLSDTPGASCIFTIGDKTQIGYPIIQYRETDWEFIKRLASHFNTSLFPQPTTALPRFWFGLRNGKGLHDLNTVEYIVKTDRKFFAMGGDTTKYKKSDFMHYIVESIEDFPIGDKGQFRGQELRICRKKSVIKNGMVIHEYDLGQPRLVSQLKYYNLQFTGSSLMGNVLSRAGQVVRLHLDIDDKQDEARAYPYTWAPPTSNLMYLMPKVGTRVSLYFSNADEGSALAINCVRTNGGQDSTDMTDYTWRGLYTEDDKFMLFYQETMALIGSGEKGTPTSFTMSDETGLAFATTHLIVINAEQKIELRGGTIVFSNYPGFQKDSTTTPLQITFLRGNVRAISESGEAPDSAMILNTSVYLLVNTGYMIYQAARFYEEMTAIDDAPRKGEFNWGKLFFNAIAGIAVFAVFIAISIGTLGTGTLIAIGVIGTIGIGAQFTADIYDGNVSSIGRYLTIGAIAVFIGLIGAAFAAISATVIGLLGGGVVVTLVIGSSFTYLSAFTSSLVTQYFLTGSVDFTNATDIAQIAGWSYIPTLLLFGGAPALIQGIAALPIAAIIDKSGLNDELPDLFAYPGLTSVLAALLHSFGGGGGGQLALAFEAAFGSSAMAGGGSFWDSVRYFMAGGNPAIAGSGSSSGTAAIPGSQAAASQSVFNGALARNSAINAYILASQIINLYNKEAMERERARQHALGNARADAIDTLNGMGTDLSDAMALAQKYASEMATLDGLPIEAVQAALLASIASAIPVGAGALDGWKQLYGDDAIYGVGFVPVLGNILFAKSKKDSKSTAGATSLSGQSTPATPPGGPDDDDEDPGEGERYKKSQWKDGIDQDHRNNPDYTWKDATDDAFSQIKKRTGIDRDEFEVSMVSMDKNGEWVPVEWTYKGEKGWAQVSIDQPHGGTWYTNSSPHWQSGPDAPHIGWKTKASDSGHTLIGDVPYGRNDGNAFEISPWVPDADVPPGNFNPK